MGESPGRCDTVVRADVEGFMIGPPRPTAKTGAAANDPDDARALRRAAAVGRGALDDAGDVPTGDRPLRPVRKLARLAAIQRECPDRDERLEGQRIGVGNLRQRNVRRLFGDREGEHALSVRHG